jgi:hypothetical protein
MDREPTLDEFGPDEGDDGAADARPGDGDGATDDGEDDGATDDAGTAADATAESAPERPTAPVTCEWTPGGAACEACGATVERRWRDGDARVCVDCKEW